MKSLTKSLFKIGNECPTKLFYSARPETYPSSKLDDEFLKSLADGGFLVGELAKLYFPEGIQIESLNGRDAVKETNARLQVEETTLFEAAIQTDHFQIRADVLRKSGNHIELIEVKSKSFDSSVAEPFRTKKGGIQSEWIPYLLDVGFQKKVLELAHPEWTVTAYLMLVDKSAECTVDGLNRKFKIDESSGRRRGVYIGEPGEEICDQTLKRIRVNTHLEDLAKNIGDGTSLDDAMSELADRYNDQVRPTPMLGRKCKTCQFRLADFEGEDGEKSGFHECWRDALGGTQADFAKPLVYDLANFPAADGFIKNGSYRLEDLSLTDIKTSNDSKPGLSRSDRQELQLKAAKGELNKRLLEKGAFSREMDSWQFPLHFIDFETVGPAIPIHKGMRPYQTLAFQFSHHTVQEDGTVQHANEFLNTDPEQFPNFEFLRNLKKAIGNDNGSVFQYSTHENTVLNHIYTQLARQGAGLSDQNELIDFVQSLTVPTKDSVKKWTPTRPMVDMRVLVSRFYFHPLMNGSESIKRVLLAMLNDSEYLQDRYSKPIYGSATGIMSRNFQDFAWIEINDDGMVKNPYDLLANSYGDLCPDVDTECWDSYAGPGPIQDGGGAMTAYLTLQQPTLSSEQRDQTHNALLRYCELDTLAMVMLYEGWREMLDA